MTDVVEKELKRFMRGLRKRNPYEEEFVQAVEEVACSVLPFILDHPEYRDAQILERMTEPDRVIAFRVTWEDDDGNVRVNRGWRVQFNRSIGPYKGGLRFHPSVNQSILKFLGFEQTFKNSLTGLPMGAGKGGANFNPKGKSDREVMRFCQNFMTNLYRYIGEDTDVPAGDIGVGSREIGYLFGQYMRLSNEFEGVLTGKGMAYGGSAIRTEATGYGCVYFCQNMLEKHGETLDRKSVVISGAGNVAVYAAEKVLELGGKVITLSDSGGFIHDPDGLDLDKLKYVKELKFQRRGRISEYTKKFENAEFHTGEKPWEIPCDVALPCATQNEINDDDARALVENGVRAVCEGANMPCTRDAVDVFQDNNVLYAPGKAANAGGVAVSGLEQTQNAMRMSWGRGEVDDRLKSIMADIHAKCVDMGSNGDGPVDYIRGANLAGFLKVADAMLAFGIV